MAVDIHLLAVTMVAAGHFLLLLLRAPVVTD